MTAQVCVNGMFSAEESFIKGRNIAMNEAKVAFQDFLAPFSSAKRAVDTSWTALQGSAPLCIIRLAILIKMKSVSTPQMTGEERR